MLSGIRIYSADAVWRQILADFNAVVIEHPEITDVDFDKLQLALPATPFDIKVAVLNALDNTEIMQNVFGKSVTLPRLPTQIIVCLYKSGGMSAGQLKSALGYAPNTTTHAIDTAIYQLRKTYGHDFIQNENGIYKLGRI